jgi:hypothetical protein
VSASESIRIGDWLASREPAPPQLLAQMLGDIVHDERCGASELPKALMAHAVALLDEIGNDRAAAVHLLAADALISYAMEAAAETNIDFDGFAAAAASRIALPR